MKPASISFQDRRGTRGGGSGRSHGATTAVDPAAVVTCGAKPTTSAVTIEESDESPPMIFAIGVAAAISVGNIPSVMGRDTAPTAEDGVVVFEFALSSGDFKPVESVNLDCGLQ